MLAGKKNCKGCPPASYTAGRKAQGYRTVKSGRSNRVGLRSCERNPIASTSSVSATPESLTDVMSRTPRSNAEKRSSESWKSSRFSIPPINSLLMYPGTSVRVAAHQPWTRVSAESSEDLIVYKNVYSDVDKKPRASNKLLKTVVGASGFEPPTSWSRTRRASQAALRPEILKTTANSLSRIPTDRNQSYCAALPAQGIRALDNSSRRLRITNQIALEK